ncbi:hypothetical protein ACQ4M4_26410 [Leptolyngbya sp. AN02str]
MRFWIATPPGFRFAQPSFGDRTPSPKHWHPNRSTHATPQSAPLCLLS